MDDEKFDALVRDTRIVRNPRKIVTVRENAAFLMELRKDGGAGQVLGGWPSTDYIGLLDLLKKQGAHLGGNSAQYAMRFMKRDSFILSQDVTARLIAEGIIDKPAGSKSSMKAVQAAFNVWMDQSSRSLTEISRVLAMSV
jgi:3-methyladenine DNA glycosylase Tag